MITNRYPHRKLHPNKLHPTNTVLLFLRIRNVGNENTVWYTFAVSFPFQTAASLLHKSHIASFPKCFIPSQDSYSLSICLTTHAGFPAATVHGGTSFVTTAPAATTAPSPTVTPFNMIVFIPTHALSHIRIGFVRTTDQSLLARGSRPARRSSPCRCPRRSRGRPPAPRPAR